jgi:hypothetical protein
MAADIVLTRSEGYQPQTVPTVTIDVHGKVYTARRPKNTVPLLVADVQERFVGLADIPGQSEDQVRGVLGEMRDAVRLLVRAMFSDADTDDILRRLTDPAEESMDLAVIFEVYGAVQNHFAEDITGEFDDMGLEAPQQVKKAAAKKSGSRRPVARKAAPARR